MYKKNYHSSNNINNNKLSNYTRKNQDKNIHKSSQFLKKAQIAIRFSSRNLKIKVLPRRRKGRKKTSKIATKSSSFASYRNNFELTKLAYMFYHILIEK